MGHSSCQVVLSQSYSFFFFFFSFLTFGNTSSICPFNERVVSTSYCCRKSFVTVGFPQLATSLYTTPFQQAICFWPWFWLGQPLNTSGPYDSSQILTGRGKTAKAGTEYRSTIKLWPYHFVPNEPGPENGRSGGWGIWSGDGEHRGIWKSCLRETSRIEHRKLMLQLKGQLVRWSVDFSYIHTHFHTCLYCSSIFSLSLVYIEKSHFSCASEISPLLYPRIWAPCRFLE